MHRSLITIIISFISTISIISVAQAADDPPRPPSLKTISVPEPSNLADFVVNKEKAVALGKALFWEMRVGSDGITACASCHFNAGADSRSINQINPNSLAVNQDGSSNPDLAFDFKPNHQLTASDFSFRQLSDLLSRGSDAVIDSNDVSSSQGVFAADFIRTEPGQAKDIIKFKPDPDGFRLNNLNLRRVEPRNTPTVVNAAFNFRNFFDGRAQNDFNGINNWGARDANAKVFKAASPDRLEAVKISLNNSSLASQAVGPPLSHREMSAAGRTFPDVGRKLLSMRPLALQQVHKNDSVLGGYSFWPNRGLKIRSYADMVKAAFHPQWWNSGKRIRAGSASAPAVVDAQQRRQKNTYSLMEYNFSLFFGLAVQMYEATLIADDTPYDRFMQGDAAAISEAAVRGVDVFRSQARGRCINCHEGAELTGASITRVTASPVRIREEQAIDRGFNNISVRPPKEDIGLGGTDPFGNPLANIRRVNPPNCANGLPCPVVADGFMKVPGLRNVELTAPYFHNGGSLTLREVIDFYSRGGDFAKLEQLDGSEIAHLNILLNTDQEKADLEAFLLSLTDERVRYQKAPFDHPQLFVTNGHRMQPDGFGNAKDRFMEIKAVGKAGGQPLRKFLQ